MRRSIKGDLRKPDSLIYVGSILPLGQFCSGHIASGAEGNEQPAIEVPWLNRTASTHFPVRTCTRGEGKEAFYPRCSFAGAPPETSWISGYLNSEKLRCGCGACCFKGGGVCKTSCFAASLQRCAAHRLLEGRGWGRGSLVNFQTSPSKCLVSCFPLPPKPTNQRLAKKPRPRLWRWSQASASHPWAHRPCRRGSAESRPSWQRGG